MTSASWWVLIPAKDPGEGKSRLGAGTREAFARAFVTDVLAAARAARSVAGVDVVTGAAFGAALARIPGAAALDVVDDAPVGLNAAVMHAVARRRRASPGEPIAVLVGDVPALRPEDLDAALELVPAGGAAFVRDADGTGTVLLAARDGGLRSAFGVGSAAAHEAAGFVEIGRRITRLRRDVDTLDVLVDAAALGLGPATSAVYVP